MSDELQKKSAYARHMAAKRDGKTCTDCYKDIAHHLPKEYRDPEEAG